jgi:hypothetical protein
MFDIHRVFEDELAGLDLGIIPGSLDAHRHLETLEAQFPFNFVERITAGQ